MSSPGGQHIGFEGTGRRSVIEQSRRTVMDLKAWNNIHFSQNEFIKAFSVELNLRLLLLVALLQLGTQSIEHFNFIEDLLSGGGTSLLQLTNLRLLLSHLRLDRINIFLGLHDNCEWLLLAPAEGK